MFKVGTNTQLQMGKEKAAGFGTKVAGTNLINLTSESIKVSVDKGDEGSLLAKKTAQTRDILGVNVDGSVSFILKPEFAGLLFHCAMGGVDVPGEPLDTGRTLHTFNLCGPDEILPSFTLQIDRKTGAKAYAGCTIGALSIDAAAGDYVKGSFDLKGVKEEAGQLAELKNVEQTASYRCTEASFSFDGHEHCITSASFKIDNALEEGPKTYCSKEFKTQPMHGLRNVTIDFEIPYDEKVDSLKDNYLLTEQTGAVVLKFTSKDVNDYVEITMPHVCITDVTANVGGAGIINASISGMALSEGTDEPLTVKVCDKHTDLWSKEPIA